MEKIYERKFFRFFCGFLSFSFLIIFWELSDNQGNNPVTQVLPPPSQFLPVLFESDFKIGLGSQSATIYQSISITLIRVLSGMSLAFVGSIIVGLLLSLSKWSELFFVPILSVIAPIAPIAWVPIALVIFGIGNLTAIFIVFMGVFFTLTIATIAEIKRVPTNYIFTAANLGGSTFKIWKSVIIP